MAVVNPTKDRISFKVSAGAHDLFFRLFLGFKPLVFKIWPRIGWLVLSIFWKFSDLINALFDCVTSGPSQVLFETASNTLNTLGGKQPALFLSVTHAYILQRSRVRIKIFVES